MTSLKSEIDKKCFYNDNQTSYVEIFLSETDGTGGANDVKGYHYADVELRRRNTKGLRESAHFMFNKGEDYSTKARDFFESIKTLKEAIMIIKERNKESDE